MSKSTLKRAAGKEHAERRFGIKGDKTATSTALCNAFRKEGGGLQKRKKKKGWSLENSAQGKRKKRPVIKQKLNTARTRFSFRVVRGRKGQ